MGLLGRCDAIVGGMVEAFGGDSRKNEWVYIGLRTEGGNDVACG